MAQSDRPLITFICSDCGSDEVYSDALAQWNPETWTWEVTSVFPKGDVCSPCDGPTTMVEIELAEFIKLTEEPSNDLRSEA